MLFKNKLKIKSITTAEDIPTLILGDIHGCLESLEILYTEFVQKASSGKNYRIIALGDLIDRGPDSKGVIDWFLSAPSGEERMSLRGNHEVMFTEFVSSRSIHSSWLKVGGLETLASYSTLGPNDNWAKAELTQSVKQIPKSHVSFLHSLPDIIMLGNICLVHAAIDPHKPVSGQSTTRLHWGPCIGQNETHLVRFHDPGIKRVIHGHEPHGEPIDTRQPVINLDTGCYESGILTGLLLEQGKIIPLQTAQLKRAQ